jgi:hypothetical protein
MSNDALFYKYGKLAMRYARDKSPEVRDALLKIQENLGMTRLEIMNRVKVLAIAGLKQE